MPIREICNQSELLPSVLYGWQHHLWDHAALAFAAAKPSAREQQMEAEVAALRARLAKKEHVIAELSEELIDAKKKQASSERAVGGA